MENGHSLTKADLQAALTDLTKHFDAALSAQGQHIHDELKSQGKDYERLLQAAMVMQGKKFDEKLDARFEAQNNELKEFSRQIETNLLTAFHGYSKGQQARMHTVEITEADFKLRLAAIEERVLALETRRPPPPEAPKN